MKTVLTSTALALALSVPLPALASHDRNWSYAKVVHADPIYRQVRITEPVDECREVPVTRSTHYRSPDPAAVLIGGIIGGVIGHQFGGGHGRDVATAAGAVIGAQHAARRHSTVQQVGYETHCSTRQVTRYRQHIVAYDVTYKHRGRLYRMETSEHPGKKVRIRH